MNDAQSFLNLVSENLVKIDKPVPVPLSSAQFGTAGSVIMNSAELLC
jgi:hypothetical protein